MGAIGGGAMGGGVGGVSQITRNRDAQILIEKRKLARQQAEAVNRRNAQQGHSDILNSGSVDEAIQAANNATSKKSVTKDDVLRTIDPTLADIERLTGLKPSESIEQAINQAQQGLSAESIPAQGQQGNVAPSVDVGTQKKPVTQNDISEYAQLINDVEARKNNSPDTWTESDEKMLSLAKEKLNSITQPKGNIYEEETSQAPSTKKSTRILGNSTEIVLPDNITLPAQWEIVDADNIKATIKEGVNQPRDRTRASSDIQIQEISNNLDYRRLSDSPVLDIGAPAISHDGLIVAGNGRFEAVSLAHDKGMASDYLSSLKNDAVNKGIDPAVIESMKRPVLVRRITQPYDTRKLAIDSNAGTSLQYSGMELAKIDAERMKGIEDLDITDTGDIALTGSNISKLKQSLGGYNNTELASLVDKNGALSQDGVRRVRNSLLAKAYGDSGTLGRLVESTDNDARNVLGALTRSAGVVAKVRSDIKAGALPKELDITNSLLDAAETLSQVRSKGQPLEQYLAQDNLFGDDIDADSKEILKFLHDNIRSQKKLTEFIKNVYSQISNIDQTAEDIFGDNVIPSKQDVIQNAKQSTAGQTAEQQDIFARQPGKADEQAAQTKASYAGSSKESEQDSRLNTDTRRTVFDSFSSLGNDAGSAIQAMYDAEQITGLKLGIPIEYVKLDKGIPARFNTDRRIIEVTNDWNLSKSEGAQFLAEEILNYVDSVSKDRTISASSQLLDWSNGGITKEAIDHYNSNGLYEDFLRYPIDNITYPELSKNRREAELFARLGVLYFGEPERMAQSLPTSYKAYHDIFKVTGSPVSEEISRKIWTFSPSPYRKVGSEYKSMGSSLESDGRFVNYGNISELGKLREILGVRFRGRPSGAKADFSEKGSLDTKPLFSRSPEERIKDRERAKQLESKLKEQGYNFTIQAKDVRDFAAMDRSRQNEAVAAEQIAANFGKIIVWIEAIGDFEINGVMIPSIKDAIFIDVTTDKYARAVMGHELSHHMERDNPDLYRDLVDSLENLIKNHDEYADKYGIEGEDRGYITKEIVGDIMGDNFTDQEFWNKVAEYNPSAFRKIADKIISWLKNLVVKAKSRGLGSEQWVTDAQEAQDIIAKAVAKYTNKKSSLDGLTNKAMFQKAWHGSPFDHDKFDSSKIGTGEGMQAYGFGHYFSDSKHVAEWYKNKLSKEGKLYEVELAPKQDEYLLYDVALDEQSDKVRDALRGKLIVNGVDILSGNKRSGKDLYKSISQSLDGDKEASKFLHNLGIKGTKYLDGSSRYDAYEVVLSTKKGKYSSIKFESKDQAEQYAKEKREEGFSAKVRFNENASFNYVIFDDKDVSIAAKFSRSKGWGDFPNAVIGQRSASGHKDYQAAKDGDFVAAVRLANDTVTPEYLADIKNVVGDSNPIVVPIRSAEKAGAANAIPEAVGMQIASKLNIDFDENGIQQIERVGRTGADGWHRIANQPSFEGDVEKNRDYIIVDDTLAQGGTVAQLKEYIENNGGKVSLITALTGKEYSAKIGLSVSALQLLRDKHGSIESWFRKSFGYGFEGLTESEARFIVSAKGLSSEQVRAKIAEAKRDGADSNVQEDKESSIASFYESKAKFSKAAQDTVIPETTNIDGVDRPTRNSEGKLIHPTEDGIRNFYVSILARL